MDCSVVGTSITGKPAADRPASGAKARMTLARR
jgi:hypothetical protein